MPEGAFTLLKKIRNAACAGWRWLTGKTGRWLLAAVVIFILTAFFGTHRSFTESVYSRTLYPVLAVPIGLFSDLFPFSLQELVFFGLLFFFFYKTGRGMFALFKKQRRFRELAISALRRTGITISIIYCLFYLLWGFNYFRTRLIESPRYNADAVNTKNLNNLLRETIRQANSLAVSTPPKEDTLQKDIEKNLTAVIRRTTGQSFRSARNTKKFLSGYLGMVGISGICLPWLQEAHIASDLLPYEIPFITAHEKSHIKGRTSEAEANYFAWRACLASGDAAVRYSGHFSILPYLLGALPAKERRGWIKKISPAVLAHYKKRRERNRKRSRILSRIAARINHIYLKANRVRGGSRNYSHVVKLALGYNTDSKKKNK